MPTSAPQGVPEDCGFSFVVCPGDEPLTEDGQRALRAIAEAAYERLVKRPFPLRAATAALEHLLAVRAGLVEGGS